MTYNLNIPYSELHLVQYLVNLNLQAYHNPNTGTIFAYDESGYWKERDMYYIYDYLKELNITNSNISRANRHLRAIVLRYADYLKRATNDDFNSFAYQEDQKMYFNCLNSVLEIDIENKTVKQLAHDPKYLFNSQLQIKYSSNYSSGYWMDRLNEVLDHESLELLLLYFTYSMLPFNNSFHSVLYCFGKNNTGKTTIINAFSKVFQNVSTQNLKPQNITTYSGLENVQLWFLKRFNQKILLTSTVRQIINKDRSVLIRSRKKYDKIINPKFSIMVTANNLIKLQNVSEFRRTLPIYFKNVQKKDENVSKLLHENLDDFISYLLTEYVFKYYANIKKISNNLDIRTHAFSEKYSNVRLDI